MKIIDKRTLNNEPAHVGDIMVLEDDTKILVCKNLEEDYPFLLINLNNFESEDVYMDNDDFRVGINRFSDFESSVKDIIRNDHIQIIFE